MKIINVKSDLEDLAYPVTIEALTRYWKEYSAFPNCSSFLHGAIMFCPANFSDELNFLIKINNIRMES